QRGTWRRRGPRAEVISYTRGSGQDIIPEECSPLVVVVVTSPGRTVDLSDA
ncbi:MAG: hypothetical protein J07HQW2_02194, partial [Haloquadratum walsbyi J07HQW2]